MQKQAVSLALQGKRQTLPVQPAVALRQTIPLTAHGLDGNADLPGASHQFGAVAPENPKVGGNFLSGRKFVRQQEPENGKRHTQSFETIPAL